MKSHTAVFGWLCVLCALTLAVPIAVSQEPSTQGAAQVHLVITNEAVRGDGDVPTLQSSPFRERKPDSSVSTSPPRCRIPK